MSILLQNLGGIAVWVRRFSRHYSEACSASILILVAGILLFTMPYWVFGEHSMIGWYDEFEGTFPWYLRLNSALPGQSFFHDYAGGIGAREAFLDGLQVINFYGLLLKWLGPFWATMIGRWILLFFSVLGLQRLFSEVAHIETRWAALLSVCTLFFWSMPIGWTLSAIGVVPGACAWLLTLFDQSLSLRTTLTRLLVVTAIVATTTVPFFSIPISCWAVFLFLILFPKARHKRNALLFGLLICSFILQLMNWGPGIQDAILNTLEYSERLRLETSDVTVQDSLNFASRIHYVLVNHLEVLATILRREPGLYSFGILIWLTVLGLLAHQTRMILVFYLGLLILPSFLGILIEALRFSPFNKFRYLLFWELFPLFVFFMGAKFSQLLPSPNNLFVPSSRGPSRSYMILSKLNVSAVALSIGLLIGGLGSFGILRQTFGNLTSLGGFSVMSVYSKLTQLAKSESPSTFRVISVGDLSWNIPVFYGLHAFDGFAQNFSTRRSRFVMDTIYNPSLKFIRHARHTFRSWSKDIDLRGLGMAGVKYVLSDRLIDSPSLKLLSEEGPPFFSESVVCEWFNWFDLCKSLVGPPLKVYQIDLGLVWPRVFSVESLKVSQLGRDEDSFGAELRELRPGSVLVAKDDIDLIPTESEGLKFGAHVLSFELIRNGFEVDLDGVPGLVVFNQVFIPNRWTANCNTKDKLNVFPVNGIHMAVAVPSRCTKLVLTYR